MPASARMYLLNALYFKGIWKNQFKKSDTKAELFTSVDGSRSTVQMMNMSRERFNYTENECFSIAEFPYGNEAFSMVVLLPAEGKSLEECLPQLTDEHWREWNNTLSGTMLNVKLPRFRLKYDKGLIEDMQEMEMKDAFDSRCADFSKMSNEELFVDLLQQYTYVKVDEEGTEAAAVTIAGMVDAAAPGQCGHSFLCRPSFRLPDKGKEYGNYSVYGESHETVTAIYVESKGRRVKN